MCVYGFLVDGFLVDGFLIDGFLIATADCLPVPGCYRRPPTAHRPLVPGCTAHRPLPTAYCPPPTAHRPLIPPAKDGYFSCFGVAFSLQSAESSVFPGSFSRSYTRLNYD
jgi:hypothetical protein